MKAVVTALDLLEDGGGLLVAVYPGHEEGTLEGLMLDDYFASLDRKKISVSKLKIVNSPSSPSFSLPRKNDAVPVTRLDSGVRAFLTVFLFSQFRQGERLSTVSLHGFDMNVHIICPLSEKPIDNRIKKYYNQSSK